MKIHKILAPPLLSLFLLSVFSLLFFSSTPNCLTIISLLETELPIEESTSYSPQWLNERFIWWKEVSIPKNQGGLSQTSVYLQDCQDTKNTICLFQTAPSNATYTIDLRQLDGTIALYFLRITENQHTQGKILFKTNSLAQFKTICYPPDPIYNMENVSIQEDFLVEPSMLSLSDAEQMHITMYPLGHPEKAYTSEDIQKNRYSLLPYNWSTSGEYFVLQNMDRFGMENFSSLAELLTAPYEIRPQKAQYDVFNRRGEFCFSLEADWLTQENVHTNTTISWITDNLLMTSTRYSYKNADIRFCDRLYSINGSCLWQMEYSGSSHTYFSDSSENDQLFYTTLEKDGIHLFLINYKHNTLRDCGRIVDYSDALNTQVSPNPRNSNLLLYNNKTGAVKVIKIQKAG